MDTRIQDIYGVAPHAGAWIETIEGSYENLGIYVAPHAGAWIETGEAYEGRKDLGVAPHAGAWIETYGYDQWLGISASHPMRVRGLKPHTCVTCRRATMSHPMRVRGLKR